jgi:alanine racemase
VGIKSAGLFYCFNFRFVSATVQNMSISKEQRSGLRTWIELDSKAISHNYSQFRSLIKKETKLCAVVKSNAYGHGLVDFSREIIKCGADWLAVDSITEGLRLRQEGIKIPILILGYTLPEKFIDAVEADLSLSISHFDALQALLNNKFSKKPKVHIKVDTGMHRQGFMMDHAAELLQILIDNPTIEVEGLFTHFAAAKNPSFPAQTKKQIEEFSNWVQLFDVSGFSPIIHAAATSGTILFPESHFDMVRIGIGLFGLWPSREVKAYAENKVPLQPVLSWKTIISEVKKLPKGSSIGYDFTETLDRNSTLVICPIGYWHGFPRSLSSIGSAIVGGKKVRVVGRVSMDMVCFDVTGIKSINVGDEVVIIGNEGKEEITAMDIATVSDSSWYEILTRINPLIKKIII